MKAYYWFVSILMLLAIGGWGMNLFKLIVSMDAPITIMFIMRIIGLFLAPLGVILGYF
jgi:hypothetical protein